jgi:hypothetical protein
VSGEIQRCACVSGLQYKHMEHEFQEARGRIKALQEAKDKLDNEWAENFGTRGPMDRTPAYSDMLILLSLCMRRWRTDQLKAKMDVERAELQQMVAMAQQLVGTGTSTLTDEVRPHSLPITHNDMHHYCTHIRTDRHIHTHV